MISVGILGGLIGSILTVLINKGFEMLQKSKEHKYHLQKTFFENKLRAAEAAVSQWTNVATSTGSLATLYNRMKETDDFNPTIFQTFNDQYSAQINNAVNATGLIASSILLYFDIDQDSFWDNKPLETLFESLSNIQNLSEQLDLLYDQQARVVGTEYEGIVQKEIDRLFEEAKKELENLSKVIEDARIEMVKYIGSVRDEMKKFEA